ncbi:Lrp/AsnC family transcriptional regulator [Nocardiopsis sp. FIRDI 009]|uniref:Lrp/AsnC family transcriptional regulator n=1 Tax=Nocardiopsis sp. FIRDI 009 TaxID=714197 RepID=UPI001E46BE6E|nr:Lrp/AsnC family transcriptional regulator [Nocardiopsis sp. FIRDI 009]
MSEHSTPDQLVLDGQVEPARRARRGAPTRMKASGTVSDLVGSGAGAVASPTPVRPPLQVSRSRTEPRRGRPGVGRSALHTAGRLDGEALTHPVLHAADHLLDAVAEGGQGERAPGGSVARRTPAVGHDGESDVIGGYTAVVDPELFGFSALAFVRLRYPVGNRKPCLDLLATTLEITEARHVTGEDCYLMKAVARSMRHLEEVVGRIAALGPVTTNVVYSSPVAGRSPIGGAGPGGAG